MRYILDQKDDYILQIIQDLFGFGKITFRSETNRVYQYIAKKFESINDVIFYFKVFLLLTKNALF